MAERIWDKFLTERDKAVFSASGYGAQAELGKRPALLIIDVSWGFCGDKPEPILESIKRWRNSCGAESWDAIKSIKAMIDVAHERGLPVIYTTGSRRPDAWDSGSWAWKNGRASEDKVAPAPRALDDNQIVTDIAPAPQDIVVLKQKPSGFHGTPMQSYLTLLGCDSVIVTGTTTSGCVRATVIDAFSNNFRVIVPEDACFDRAEASHAVSLCDMNAKYANVVHSAQVLDYMKSLPKGMFDLPKGAPSA
jgi:nicotinamidase-related amidase